MRKVEEVADEEDWQESDGWVGKWTILGQQNFSSIYEIRNGRFYPTAERQEYTGQVEMSEDTFIDLVAGAVDGHGEDVFANKYAKRAIRYTGKQWVVDSERFRKVLRRLRSAEMRKRL